MTMTSTTPSTYTGPLTGGVMFSWPWGEVFAMQFLLGSTSRLYKRFASQSLARGSGATARIGPRERGRVTLRSGHPCNITLLVSFKFKQSVCCPTLPVVPGQSRAGPPSSPSPTGGSPPPGSPSLYGRWPRTHEGPKYCRVVCYLKEIQIVL